MPCAKRKMRTAFFPQEYLTVQQVTSAFSRMSAQYRKGQLKKPEMKETSQTETDMDEEEGENEDEDEDEEEEDEDEEDFDNMDNDINEAVNSIQINPEVGKFVYVGSVSKVSHYAGQITKVKGSDIEVSFLSRSKNTFMWPSPLQVQKVLLECIHLELDVPVMGRRDHLTFSNEDIRAMSMCCTHLFFLVKKLHCNPSAN